MILGAGILVGVSALDDHTTGAATGTMMAGYVVGFIALFLLSGIGNGSVYKMIPSIFEARSRSLEVSEAERVAWSRAMSGALIGFAGAIGALGGVGINLALRQSYLTSHSATSAFWIFLAFYVLASVVTWVMYVRRPSSASVDAPHQVDLARA
jgi:NNP family nitrate/nitrite transporter-like MFS transporter